MGANQSDHEDVRTISLVKMAAALDALAVIHRYGVELDIEIAKGRGLIKTDVAKKLRNDLAKALEPIGESAKEVLSIFSDEQPGGAVARADELLKKARAEQEENHDA